MTARGYYLSHADVRGGHFLLADVAGLPAALSGQLDCGLSSAAHVVAQLDVASRFVLQEREESHFPGRHHTEPLHLAVQRQEHPLHGQVSRFLFKSLVLVLLFFSISASTF